MMSSNVLPRPAQPPVDIASLNVPVPPPVPAPVPAPAGRERDPLLVRRVRDLEEEVRNLRAENEKQVCLLSHALRFVFFMGTSV